jgi:Rrf2 family protein
VRAKLLISQHGIRGGYTLARDAHQISAFDVIRAVEGPLFMTSCVTVHGECEQVDRCTVKEPLRRVSQSIEEVLSRITIGEMARERNGDRAEVRAELVTIEN